MKQLVIDAKTCNLDVLLNFINQELEKKGCPTNIQHQIDIAAEEIFVNIAHYAYVPGTGQVTVGISVGDQAVIEFWDNGSPYNPLERPEPDIHADIEQRKIGGLGIYMVKKSMDAVEYRYEDKKNRLTIKKSLDKFEEQRR